LKKRLFGIVIALLIILASWNIFNLYNKNNPSSLVVNSLKTDEEIGINTTANEFPHYYRFILIPGNEVGFTVPIDKTGSYQIVIGTNKMLESKYNTLINTSIIGNEHKNIPYTMHSTEGRIFKVLDFSLNEEKAYLDHKILITLGVNTEKYDSLSKEEKIELKDVFIEVGVKRLN
jgi:hypothetical protein